VTSTPPATYDIETRAVLRAISDLPPGTSVSVNWTIRVNVGATDLSRVLSEAIVTYVDPTGTPLPREREFILAHALAPVFAPVLMFNRATADRGEEIVATLHYNNTGSVVAPWAEAIWSLDGHYDLVALVPATPFEPRTGGFRVEFANVSSGNHALLARLKVLRSFDDGLLMPIAVSWNATDGNANRFNTLVLGASAVLDAPRVDLTLVAPDDVSAGSVFVLTVILRNLGKAPAMGWLNLSIPESVDLVGDNGSREPTIVGRLATWTFLSIPAEGAMFFGISLQAKPVAVVQSFRLSLDYTDAAGSAPLTVFSNTGVVGIRTSPGEGFPMYVGWILLAALGVMGAVVAIGRQRRGPRASVEEVFVADMSGVLLAHRRAHAVARPDEDVLIAMFKVVQDFVRDAFSEAADEEMSALEFGERKILIERGKHHFVAVVYRGTDHGGVLNTRVKHVSREIDERFGPILASWSGELDTVRGIALLLPKIWRRGSFSAVPQAAAG
jgi:hypothetical protein